MTSEEQRSGHIVVGVDGSEHSKAALRWAARVAPLFGGVIEAVTAWNLPPVASWEAALLMDPVELERAAQQILDDTLADVFGIEAPVGLVRNVAFGDPARILIAASEHAELVVVGARGVGPISGLLLGSVSSRCAERARCPITVVHER